MVFSKIFSLIINLKANKKTYEVSGPCIREHRFTINPFEPEMK